VYLLIIMPPPPRRGHYVNVLGRRAVSLPVAMRLKVLLHRFNSKNTSTSLVEVRRCREELLNVTQYLLNHSALERCPGHWGAVALSVRPARIS